ncbi:flagellar motor switch protein FliN [Blastopirellula marina]|uniref:Flagellar motor switch protein FliN n=1 Tax=Blastopirellula marina TaxID=124 RepID=A0A2S8FDA0_9BACT|nr:flagellar motor switch protein FliN [Blastopirellula marina]PQO29904.1 flagellar motor switch protein FliN [Blastopirellula marina]PTL42372.1 flagellar motor switch protein FliN [Blastopirellula marina]
MTDDDQMGQDEIEELLRQAQSGNVGPSEPTAKPPQDLEALDQSEIEALFSSPGASEAPKPKPKAAAAATATKPVASAPTSGEGHDDMEYLLNQAEAALASLDSPSQDMPAGISPFTLRDFGGSPASTDKATIDLVRDVELDVKIELGQADMYLEEVLQMKKGSVVPLDKLAGDPVDIFVNGRLIAKGEVLILNDNFCVRITELIVGDSVI